MRHNKESKHALPQIVKFDCILSFEELLQAATDRLVRRMIRQHVQNRLPGKVLCEFIAVFSHALYASEFVRRPFIEQFVGDLFQRVVSFIYWQEQEITRVFFQLLLKFFQTSDGMLRIKILKNAFALLKEKSAWLCDLIAVAFQFQQNA